ncbi:MAG: hypothetical protein OXU19_12970 [bacterium]|nr:hypothetical protein [bacterium]MDE0240816.1 hypothetical protein [bacterium]
MSAPVRSRHAETRMRQRGLRPSDPDVVLLHGSQIGGDIHEIYFLKHKDAQREIDRLKGEIRRLKQAQGSFDSTDREREVRRLKHDIHALERLRGRKLVVAEGMVVTFYRSNRRDWKRMSRRGREYA